MASKKPKAQESSLANIVIGVVGSIIVLIAAFFGINFSTDDAGTQLPTQPASRPTQIVASNPTAIPQNNGTGGQVQLLSFAQGYGARKDFWQVYFTAPTGISDRSTYVGGVDQAVVDAVNSATRTLDIAAFEWNNPLITNAVVAAKNRGVVVRMVVDNEHAVEDEDSTIQALIDIGIPMTYDERSAFMHNKFMIIDSTLIITGSMNFTMNDTYRNNNNMLFMRSTRAVSAYQKEFDQMFAGTFGPKKEAHELSFTADGVSVRILFAPSGDVLNAIISELQKAQSQIRFMTFSFTEDSIGNALLARAGAGIKVSGVFETRGSETDSSELPRLFCVGIDARQDGNGYTLHHKVFIVDENTVITGSFNISQNATRSNDENLVIIQSPDIARLYIQEFERIQSQARQADPADMRCG
ncbi:MAG TPA: phospholipase D-like domain-containing protein [Aggregatilineales bacterium]|nr:phospholipase D-like domain-containing protein [Aggregatilineales bacterium]